jgi:hypothetical protein
VEFCGGSSRHSSTSASSSPGLRNQLRPPTSLAGKNYCALAAVHGIVVHKWRANDRRPASSTARRYEFDVQHSDRAYAVHPMKMLHDGIPKSGRRAEWVFYMFRGKQCRRRYVIPRDPRTPGQLRSRAAFAAASKNWSHSGQLTEKQRLAWNAAGAKIQSHPRLGRSGPLTGQQHYVGRNCASTVIREEMLWEPAKQAEKMAVVRRKSKGCGGRNTEFTPELPRSQRIARPTLGIRPGCTGVASRQHCGRKLRSAGAGVRTTSSQAVQSQTVPRPTWERYRGSSVPLPGCCRWTGERPARFACVCAFRLPRILAGVSSIGADCGLRPLGPPATPRPP